MTDHVDVQRCGAVARITLNRPEKKNALTTAMYRHLIDAMQAAQSESGCGAILIEGAGGSFTAGNDIGDFLASAGRPEGMAALEFVRAISVCALPVVAAVDGVAVGVGTTMLLHCDLVYAAPSAMFRMPFVDLGVVPEAAASLLVPARFGRQQASELLLLCEPFDVARAHVMGLVNAVVPAGELSAHALERAQALAAKPREALRLTRDLMRGDPVAIAARIDLEAQMFGERLRSAEARDAMVAFMSRGKGK